MIALSEKELIPYLAELRTSTWEAVRISGLAHVKEDSEEYKQGTKSVQAGLSAVSTDSKAQPYGRQLLVFRLILRLTVKMTQPDSPPLMIVIMPKQAHFHSRRDSVHTEKFNDTKAVCYASESACGDATSCSDRGSCSLLGKVGDKECWGCKCASGYAGSECQKVDYTM